MDNESRCLACLINSMRERFLGKGFLYLTSRYRNLRERERERDGQERSSCLWGCEIGSMLGFLQDVHADMLLDNLNDALL